MNKICSRRSPMLISSRRTRRPALVVSHLTDDAHDITTTVEVGVPGMRILAGTWQVRHPIDVCPMIERNVKRLVGLNLLKDYNMRSLMIMLGSKGCGNAMQILNTGLQSFVYEYYPHLIRIGKMSVAEWEEIPPSPACAKPAWATPSGEGPRENGRRGRARDSGRIIRDVNPGPRTGRQERRRNRGGLETR